MTPDQFSVLIESLDTARWPEIATLVVLVVTLLAAGAAAYYARQSFFGDHRRSQRKQAMEMCIKWSEFNAPETSSVTKLIERLSGPQCENIVKTENLVIEKGFKYYLMNILQFRFPNIESHLENLCAADPNDRSITLETRYVMVIRFVAVRYLNMLESILLAWSTGIADKSAIEKEFKYLFDRAESRSAMQNFREKMGIAAFPAIHDFQARLADLERDPNAVERPPVV